MESEENKPFLDHMVELAKKYADRGEIKEVERIYRSAIVVAEKGDERLKEIERLRDGKKYRW
jgi:hypothetical protein